MSTGSQDSNDLPAGTIAGITVAIVAVGVAIFVIAVLQRRRYGRPRYHNEIGRRHQNRSLTGQGGSIGTLTEAVVGARIWSDLKTRVRNGEDEKAKEAEYEPVGDASKLKRFKQHNIPERDIKNLPLGLNLIHDPDTSADCNIVFVHGFFGDNYSTWAHRSGALWIKDGLPNTMPNARIWAYSYSTKVADGKSYKTTRACARELLMEFLARRIDKIDNRLQWVFVCHCTAGFMVAEAFADASLSHSSPYSAFRNIPIRGIVFLSTPFNRIPGLSSSRRSYNIHRWLAFWQSNSATRMLLEYAEPDEEVLKALKARFEVVAPDRIVSFYDTQGARFGLPLYDAAACILGLPQESAVPCRQLHLDAVFQDYDDVDFRSLCRAIESCAYDPPCNVDNALVTNRKPATVLQKDRPITVYPGEPLKVLQEEGPLTVVHKEGPLKVVHADRPLTVLHKDGPLKVVYGGGPVQVVQGDGIEDVTSETHFKSRSLPDGTVSAQDPVFSTKIPNELALSTSSFMQIQDNLEASKAFLRAAADTSPGLSIPFQYWAGAIAGTGILTGAAIGGINARTARITANATAKSADAAMLSSQVAERKLMFDMRKELEDEKKVSDAGADQKQPSLKPPKSNISKPGPSIPGPSVPGLSRLGPTVDGYSSSGPSRTVTLSSNMKANSERLKQEEKNIRRMKEDLERSSVARKSIVQNSTQTQKRPLQAEDSKISGRLQQLRWRVLGAETRPRAKASRKGKEKAIDEDAISTDFLELDYVDTDTTAWNQHLPGLQSGRTLNIIPEVNIADEETDPLANNINKPLQNGLSQAKSLSNGSKNVSATANGSDSHSASQDLTKPEDTAEHQTNGNTVAPRPVQLNDSDTDPAEQTSHQSMLPGKHVPAGEENTQGAQSGAINKTEQDGDSKGPS